MICACGCNEEFNPTVYRFKRQWITPKYIHGHNKSVLGKHINSRENHPNWKGGKNYNDVGYVLVLEPTHPFSNSMGYVREHRLIWEENNNAILLPWTDIHHKNGNRDDNRIDNLEPLIHGKHSAITHKKDMSNRICVICNKNDYEVRLNCKSTSVWYKKEKGWVCRICHNRIYK